MSWILVLVLVLVPVPVLVPVLILVLVLVLGVPGSTEFHRMQGKKSATRSQRQSLPDGDTVNSETKNLDFRGFVF